MGAPGYYVLCPEGHLIGMIEDDLYWGEPEDESSVYKELEKLQKSRCNVCNKLAKYEFCHYGDINDCLDHDNKIEYDGDDTYIIPKNHVGNVILRSAGVHRKQPKSILDKESSNIIIYLDLPGIQSYARLHETYSKTKADLIVKGLITKGISAHYSEDQEL